MNTETADWDFCPVTDEDRAVIEQEHKNAPSGASCISFRTNACIHTIRYEGDEAEVAQEWELRARIVIRRTDGSFTAVRFSADVPYREMTIQEAREKWQGIMVDYFVHEWYPAFERGDFNDEG